MALDVRIKRVYAPADLEDGCRVLVDRLWPRGVSKEEARLDHWLKEVAPSTELRRWFGHDPARWDEFQARYRRELDANPEAIDRLKAWGREERLTLVYSASDTARNDAVVLAAYLDDSDVDDQDHS